MNGADELSVWTVVAFVTVAAVSIGVGLMIGYGEARQRQLEEREAIAAAKCPGCASITAPAKRLAAGGAVINGVEWFGDREDPRYDPVVDANLILRAAVRRIDAMDTGGMSGSAPVALTGRRPYNR